jgi:magnesium-transporting ATPase (P-type)
MVLTDDNFASIEAAVEEGRSVLDNLTKFIVWTLPTNLGEGLVILVAVLAGITLPILPTQILWINMTTAVLLGIMLAFEPKEPSLMRRQPRNAQSPILTAPLLRRISLVGLLLLGGSFGLFEWALWNGASEPQARTVAVNVFVFGAAAFLWNCRSLRESCLSLGLFSNPWIWLGIGLTIVTQFAFTYLPFMQVLFHSAAIGPAEWAAILLFSVTLALIIEFEKWLLRIIERRQSTWRAPSIEQPATMSGPAHGRWLDEHSEQQKDRARESNLSVS